MWTPHAKHSKKLPASLCFSVNHFRRNLGRRNWKRIPRRWGAYYWNKHLGLALNAVYSNLLKLFVISMQSTNSAGPEKGEWILTFSLKYNTECQFSINTCINLMWSTWLSPVELDKQKKRRRDEDYKISDIMTKEVSSFEFVFDFYIYQLMTLLLLDFSFIGNHVAGQETKNGQKCKG